MLSPKKDAIKLAIKPKLPFLMGQMGCVVQIYMITVAIIYNDPF